MSESETKSSIKLTCNNCDHTWDYSGNQKFYCTCPNCRYKVNISKQRGEYIDQ